MAPSLSLFFNPHPRKCLVILDREKGLREREGGRERERETSIGFLPYVPQLGIEPAT